MLFLYSNHIQPVFSLSGFLVEFGAFVLAHVHLKQIQSRSDKIRDRKFFFFLAKVLFISLL